MQHLSQQTFNQALATNHKIIQTFWKRWHSEYIPTLNKNLGKNRNNTFNVGDVVLLNEGPIKKHRPLARIVEKIIGRDGKARSFKLFCRNKIITRHLNSLHNLEITCDSARGKCNKY